MSYYKPGLHLCRVTRQGWTETDKEPKRPMLVFEFQVLAEIEMVTEGDETREVYHDVLPSEYVQTARLVIDAARDDSMKYAMLKLRYAGFDGDSFADLNLEGQEIRCRNEHHEYKGKQVDGWDLALPPLPPHDKPEINEIDGQMSRKLDTLFGKRLKDSKPRAEPKPSSETEPQPIAQTVPPPNDEVPF